MKQSWMTKVRTFFAALIWVMSLNVLWLAGTASGLFLFGAGPASLASLELIHRRMKGEKLPQFRAFYGSYRRNFARGNAVGLPLVLAGAALFQGWAHYLVQLTFGAQLIASLMALTSLLFAGTVCYVFPMVMSGGSNPLECTIKAARHAMCNLPQTVLMLTTTVGWGYFSLRIPLVFVLFSFSAWFLMVGWFCRDLSVRNLSGVESRVVLSRSGELRQPLVLAR